MPATDATVTDLVIIIRHGRADVLWSVSRGTQLLAMGDAPDTAAAARDAGDAVVALLTRLAS